MEPEWSPPESLDEYRMVRLLGRGAMGQVYLAHDQLLDRPVAVKFVRAGDSAARARAFDEARAIARLQHPNVVAIYRVAETAGHPYLVSEYVRGTTLDELARPVPWKKVLTLAIDLARGLAAAHRSGVLHRDVKPANAILTDDGCGKLLDFGLAREIDAEPVFPPPRERAESPAVPTDTTMTSPSHVAPARGSSPDGGAESAIDSFDRDARDSSRLDVSGSPKPREAGTPLYMAPELWRGELATRRSDLYALGVLLYELLAGNAPHRGLPMVELADAIQNTDIPRLGSVAPDVDPALASVVDRLVERDPGARFASSEALLVALEEISEPPPSSVPEGNPYRGLAAFEAAHGSLFFGRRGEIRELVDRVAVDPITVVGGDSGTGKSSLCRAGLLPWLVDQGWSRVDVVPGLHPIRALAAALAGCSGLEEAALAQLIRESPDEVARSIRKNLRTGTQPKLLLFVDQLEELMTQSKRDEARVVATALAALGVHTPWVRVLATARSDFLSRLATLPGLGDELGRALYFLRPLTSERIREAIVRPAAVKGVTFESEALVDALVEQTAEAPGGLPLLQFTLAELWDARDADAKIIRSDALAALGGVEGALSRHADRVIAGLDTKERDAARRLLLRLVTADGTRARRSESELLSDGPTRASERTALEALVRGRIVVANDAESGAYEIAHEALISGWPTLQDWRHRSATDHAVRLRLEHAASIWDRTGRPRDLLWRRRQLVETQAFERDIMAPREAAFLAASRRSLTRRRVIGVAVLTVVVAVAVILGLTIRARARRQVEAVIGEHTGRAVAAFDDARRTGQERDLLRARAFSLFDAHRWNEGEEVWTNAEALAKREATQYRAASNNFEIALSVDASRESSRRSLADLLFSRVLRAERDHDQNLVDELSGRLAAHDDGRYQAQLAADAQVELAVEPAGARVWIEGTTRQPVTSAKVALRPGHVVFAFEAPGRAPVLLPILLAHGETAKVTLTLPPATAVPAGMIYIPPGRFLFGSADATDLRRGFLNSPPMHTVATGAYLIARHEVTFGEWIEYLDSLPLEERRKRTPSSITTQNALELVEVAPKRWRLVLAPTTRKNTAELGQPFHYDGRKVRVDQDWSRFPVTAISFDDARAYAAWLDETGKIPGARLCDEYEWERAARGADGRTYPSGATLAPDDANIDITYGRDPLGFGPDEVGSHPRSRSPFGVDDLAGNVWEWTRSVAIPETPVYRGGGWYNAELSSRSVNREPGEPTQRNVLIGVRMCAGAR